MTKLFLGIGAVIGAFLLVVVMLLLEVALHLAIAFVLIYGAEFIANLFGADLVPDGKMGFVVGVGAIISYLLGRIKVIVNK